MVLALRDRTGGVIGALAAELRDMTGWRIDTGTAGYDTM